MTKDFDYEQMLAGELYKASGIHAENGDKVGKRLAQEINQMDVRNRDGIIDLERQLFGKTPEHFYVTPPVYVDYGRHIEIGNHFFANMNCIFLDVNKIIIGDHVMFGPAVSLYTAGHPIDFEVRIEDLEFGLPIVIEDNVWVGGSATILGGVTIGKNAIVGAGAVVTKDVPANSIVAGNPAKVIRMITDEDKDKWQQARARYYESKENFTKD